MSFFENLNSDTPEFIFFGGEGGIVKNIST